jgi:hypothetical protein
MYRPTVGGIGNLFMHLCQVDTVSDTVYENNRGKYIRLEGIKVIPDDGTLPSVDVNTYLYQQSHKVIRSIVKPTDEMNILIQQYRHLVDGVEFAMQIRMCGLVKDKSFCENTPNSDYVISLERFYDVMNNTTGNVFVTSDCQHVKKTFKSKWPSRVRILDEQPIHTSSTNGNIDPWVSYLEFFLLSECPYIFVTGGKLISTFGYMAAMYGHRQFSFMC